MTDGDDETMEADLAYLAAAVKAGDWAVVRDEIVTAGRRVIMDGTAQDRAYRL